MAAAQKAPRGRPPAGAILVDGQWELTDLAVEKAAQRLELHRANCRNRYRSTRDILRERRPDLFIKANGKRRRTEGPLRSPELPFGESVPQSA